MSRRLFAVVATAAVVALTASPARAHQGNVNYESVLEGIAPATPGVSVEVLNYDDSLQLRSESDETVIVGGYEDEPYIRIAPDGTVEVNRNSPAYYLNDDRYGDVPVPESVDPAEPPDWELVDKTGQYVWHDHRIHYMTTGTPAQVTDTSARTKIFDYEVPIEVGEQSAMITGTLFWVGEDGGLPLAPFVILGALVLAGGAVVLFRRRRGTGSDEPTETKEAW